MVLAMAPWRCDVTRRHGNSTRVHAASSVIYLCRGVGRMPFVKCANVDCLDLSATVFDNARFNTQRLHRRPLAAND